MVLGKCSSALVLLLLLTGTAEALTVSGVPKWLEAGILRSLEAVWSEIPDDIYTDREGTLKVVSERLFTGYEIEVKAGRYSPVVLFTPKTAVIKPEVRLNLPELRGMSLEWFSNDVKGMDVEISRTASEVPQEALTWSDAELRKQLSVIIAKRLPGWDFTQQIYLSPEATVITLSFRPSGDMVLAVKPELYSRTIPVMFRSDLEAKLLSELSVLIGVPVKWASLHAKDIEKESSELLEDRHTVENMRANVSVKFRAGKISELTAGVDSNSLMFSVWVSAYAGLDGRYPEAGAYFGYRPSWRVKGKYNFAPEIYTELIFSLDDFGLTHRLGGKFELLENFWAGAEYQMPDSEYYMRFEYVPKKIRRPYAMWRWSLKSYNHEAEIGYRVDEHIAVGLYYDGKLGLRGMWNF